jgi:hypothetical protein
MTEKRSTQDEARTPYSRWRQGIADTTKGIAASKEMALLLWTEAARAVFHRWLLAVGFNPSRVAMVVVVVVHEFVGLEPDDGQRNAEENGKEEES